jgi:peptidyl-prolyl cis-trans isomerase A (cyclophilin A)
MNTLLGDIVLELYPTQAPITVNNFLEYINSGFYNETVFHRTINNFMIQGGSHEINPAGVPPYVIKKTEGVMDPIENESNNGLLNIRGTISMALLPGEPNSGTSGFFINQVHNSHLDGLHCVFGAVLSGMDLVDFYAQLPKVHPSLVGGLTHVPYYTAPNGYDYLISVERLFIVISGDLNYDGIVDYWDIGVLSEDWLTDNMRSNIDDMGVTDMRDFAILAGNYLHRKEWYRFVPSDIDNNLKVNFKDYAVFAGDWQKKGSGLQGDLNIDGVVNYLDLAQFAQDWQKTKP